ncbi:MAG: DNA polymerase III subunit epsilon, partial [Gammaproteobacteria bacterium]|nr:DNA polymerase III subunit epsilon [Gammaproteobacteria bacterium]
MRQIVLDTETTGLEPEQGHRVIEIGAVELIDRELTGETFHTYLNPQREIDQGALQVHGIDQHFLADKPLFGDISEAFVAFIKDAELVIHNAPFDVAFLDRELSLLPGSAPRINELCKVTD